MTKPIKCRNVGDHIYMRWVDLPPEGMWVVCLKSHSKACKFELVEKPGVVSRGMDKPGAVKHAQHGV